MFNYKAYRFVKGTDPLLDAQFSAAPTFEKLRPGQTGLFWKSGLRWHYIPYDGLQRIFRRREQVYGRLCCGGRNFIIEWLVLILPYGNELVLHIGDDVPKSAAALLEYLKTSQPQIPCGKESA